MKNHFASMHIFVILTLVGTCYVFANSGQVNAGYICVPLVCALTSLIAYWKCK